MTRRHCLTCGTDWITFGPHDPCPSCGTVQRPEIGLDRPPEPTRWERDELRWDGVQDTLPEGLPMQ